MSDGWTDPAAGEVLTPRGCPERDGSGDPCALRRWHWGRHQRTGLRAWLAQGHGRALIRSYEADDADRLEAMERPVFAEYGFVPIATQELSLRRTGGLNPTGVLFFGWLAPSERITVRLRIVCFASTAATLG